MKNYIGSESHKHNARKASILGLKKLIEIRNERIAKYIENPSSCAYCNNRLSYEDRHKKFCNSSCAAKYNNHKRTLSVETKRKIGIKQINKKVKEDSKLKITGERNGNWKGGICRKIINNKSKCIHCGTDFILKSISNNRLSRTKYCSIKCQNEAASRRMKEKATNGLLKGWTTRNVISYPEQFFINVLNNNGICFKHNHPINKRDLGLTDSRNYFLDFYLENHKIDLEIDGSQHKYRKEHDGARDEALTKNGYSVYRIKWKNINKIEGKEYIENEINKFLEYYNGFIGVSG